MGSMLHTEDSQLAWSVMPEQQGPMASIVIQMNGSLDIQDGQMIGGTAELDLIEMKIDAPVDSARLEGVAKSIKDKKMFNAIGVPIGNLELKAVMPKAASNGDTHLAKIVVTLRKKRHTLEIPVRILVANEDAIIMSQPYPVELSAWGMEPEKEGWKNNAEVSLRMRAKYIPETPAKK
jgi:hypothetical protein